MFDIPNHRQAQCGYTHNTSIGSKEKWHNAKSRWSSYCQPSQSATRLLHLNTRWFKYNRDYLCVNKSQFVPVVFETPCNIQTLVDSSQKTHCGSITNIDLLMLFRLITAVHASSELTCLKNRQQEARRIHAKAYSSTW
jgi:hypothetical protein